MSSLSGTGSRRPSTPQKSRNRLLHSSNHISALRRRATRIAKTLAATYGSPNHDNKSDPLDELVFIVLSQMTTHHSFRRVYDRAKDQCVSWEQLLEMPLDTLRALIADAGLSNQKAPRLKAILRRVREDFGSADLSALKAMPDAEVERYLTSLPGVGIKTARCVMMYSLGRKVLPVDTHVERVARRLGLLPEEIQGARVHQALEEVVPPASRYSFHVNAIAHGRAVCLPLRPRCTQCPVRGLCPFPDQRSSCPP